jgi:hypothetical protein
MSGVMEEMLIYLRRIAEALERIEVRLQAAPSPSLAEVSSAIEELHTVQVAEVEPEQIEAPQAPSASDTIIRWLRDRNIVVRSYRVLPPQDEPLDWLARFLGERFDNLRPFYEEWKRSVSRQWRWFKIHMKDFPPAQISDIVQFAYRLHEYAMLENFNYSRGSRMLWASVVILPDIINFVTGGWLERYIGGLAKSVIGRLGLDSDKIAIMNGIQIILPNQTDAEIDLLIGNEETQIWIECKTSEEYQSSIETWKKISRYLRIPKERAGVVLLTPPESSHVREWLESQIGMTVLRLNEVSTFLEFAFQKTSN